MNGEEQPPRVVFDCMVFLRGTARKTGPAAACLKLVEEGHVRLCVSPEVLAEVADVMGRPKVQRKFPELTSQRLSEFQDWLAEHGELFTEVPTEIRYERDPKDEPYLNLARAAGAQFLVSADKDLLDLAAPSSEEELTIRALLPGTEILDPVDFLRLLTREPLPETVSAYFTQLLSSYRSLIETHFPALARRLEPGGDFDCGVHVSLSVTRESEWWSFVRRGEGEAAVSASVGAFAWRPTPFVRTSFAQTGGHPVCRRVPEMGSLSPADYARQILHEQVQRLFRNEELVESWHLVYQRAYRSLEDLATTLSRGQEPVVELDLARPVSSETFRAALLKTLIAKGIMPERARLLDLVQGRIRGWRGGRSVDLGQLDADLLWLDQQGHGIDGPLLPPPDLDVPKVPGPLWTWDRYSDTQLAAAARRSLSAFVEAYREMAEQNFPTVCARMPFYRSLPLIAECAIERRHRSPSLAGSDWAWIAFRRPDPGEAESGSPVAAVVVVSHDSVGPEREQFERIRASVDPPHVPFAVSTTVTYLFDAEDWKDALLRQLERDFEQAWRELPSNSDP